MKKPIHDGVCSKIATAAITIISYLVIGVFVFIIGLGIYQAGFEPPEVYDFAIVEMEDGVYVYRENRVSTVPAHNYTVITVMDTSGDIYTIASRTISTVETQDQPRCVWKHYKHSVYRDTATIYAPADGVKYIGTVGGR